MAYSEISAKAAAVTGAVLSLFCWLFLVPYGFTGYGMMGYMIGYSSYNWGVFYVLLMVVLGVVFGGAIAFVYNWALKLK